jgi:long-chain acyl-CoA synthetase
MNRDVPAGEEGEILVRSAAAMNGYWEDSAATAATIQDGWLRTGDLGRVDQDGYYWFVGRKKEIIVRGGCNISPLEVEEALYQHPAVREVGVIGAPDAALGEVVHAFVALKDNTSATEKDLKQFLAAGVAAYKVPETITFLPDLPKGLTGKIHRKTLKDWAAEPGIIPVAPAILGPSASATS